MERKAQKIRLWFACLFTIVLFWGTLIRLNYACDTYSTIMRGFIDAGTDMLVRNGRIVTALFYWMIGVLNISTANAYLLSFLGGVVCAATAVYVLTNRLNKYSKFDYLNFLIAVLTIINPIVIDYFMFFEIVEFWGAILLAILALEELIYFWEAEGKRRYKGIVMCFVWLILCVFCYQALPAFFVVLALPFIIHYSGKKFSNFIKNNIIVALIYGGANLVNIVWLYFVGSNKSTEISSVNFSEINWAYIKGSIQMALWNGYGVLDLVFPSKTAERLLLVLVGCICVYCLNKMIREQQMHYVIKALGGAYIIAGSVFVEMALMIMGAYGRPRMFYPLGAIWGIIMIELLVNVLPQKLEASEIKRDYANKAIMGVSAVVCLLLLIGEYCAFQNIIIDRYQTNARDKHTIEIVQQAIDEYEIETGYIIKNLVFYEDSDVPWAYGDVDWCQDVQVRAWVRSWSNVASFNYFTGKKYDTGEINKEYAEYFSSMNWDSFSYNQLIFDGSILHICVY